MSLSLFQAFISCNNHRYITNWYLGNPCRVFQKYNVFSLRFSGVGHTFIVNTAYINNAVTLIWTGLNALNSIQISFRSKRVN